MKTIWIEAPDNLCIDGSGLSAFLAEIDCRILPAADRASEEYATLNTVWEMLRDTRALIQKIGARGSDHLLPHEIRKVAVGVESGAYLEAMNFIKMLATRAKTRPPSPQISAPAVSDTELLRECYEYTKWHTSSAKAIDLTKKLWQRLESNNE